MIDFRSLRFGCEVETVGQARHTVAQAIQSVGVDQSYASRLLRFTLLAPDIVEAILEGSEPSGFSVHQFARSVPEIWEEQRETWGFIWSC